MGSATRNSLNFAGEDNSNLPFESMNTESKIGVFLRGNDDCYNYSHGRKFDEAHYICSHSNENYLLLNLLEISFIWF